MPDGEEMVYTDTAHEADAISRYTAFLNLQARAYAMSDKEYLDRLDAIMEAGGVPEGGDRYAEGDLESDDGTGISQAVIEAIQDEDAASRPAGSKRVLQFEQYGGTIGEQLGLEQGHEPESEAESVRAESYDAGSEPADPGPEDGSEPESSQAETDADGIEAGSDPTLEINYEDGSGHTATAAGGTASEPEAGAAPDGSEAGDESGQPDHAGAYKHVEDPGAEKSEDEKTDELQADNQGPGIPGPADGWPGTVGATVLEDEEEQSALYGGGLHVTEHVEINDWLDELGAGTGLLQGIQTAEYIPPREIPSPAAGGTAFEKTPLMRQLDRKVEYTFGPDEKAPDKSIDGPGV